MTVVGPRHPMDELFREIVDYQRRVRNLAKSFLLHFEHSCPSLKSFSATYFQVVEVGGFWQIEDEIAEQEETFQ